MKALTAHRGKFAPFLLPLLVYASGPCSADTASGESPRGQYEIAEVIVTAEKITETLEKTPLSVTVFNQQKLEAMGAQQFADYAGSVPGLSFESLAPGEQRVLLRGVSDGVDTGLRGATQNVTGIYIDDMVVSNNQTSPDLNLFDVERVEVLKGPQGTLYGDGSVGGLIRIITHKPDPTKTEGVIEASGGDIDHGGGDYSLNGMYNTPIAGDQLALRIVGQYRDNQGFIDDVRHGLNDVNNLRQIGGRASVRWAPSDTLNLTLGVLSQKTTLGNDNDFNSVVGDLKRNSYYEEPKETRFNLYNATLDWNVGWANLVSSSSYATYDHIDHGDFTDFLETAIQSDFGVAGVILPSHSVLVSHSKTFSQEIRLSSVGSQRVTWIGGLYFYKINENDLEVDTSDGLFDFFANTLGSPLAGTPLDVGKDVAFLDPSQRNRRQFATFGELSYHFTDRLTGTVGGRWFNDKAVDTDDAGGVFAFGAAAVPIAHTTSDHNQVFRFRLADQLTDDALVYALASQGYRTGGNNPLNPATANNPIFPQTFNPDKLWNYELGFKTLWLDHRLTVNGSVFYIDWSNEQIEVALPGGYDIITNAAKTTIKGIEGDVSYVPTDGIELGINGSYLDAKLARDLVNNSDPANQVVIGRAGDQLTGVPKTQGSLYAQWHFPLAAGVEGVVRSDLQYVGRTGRFFAHDSRVPAPADEFQDYGDYSLVNLRGGAEWTDLSVMLYVKNLADRRAVFFRGLQGTSSTPTRDDVYVAQPRTIGVTVNKRF